MEKVVRKKREIYGESHPNYIQALEDLALTLWQNYRVEETKANYAIAIKNTLNYISTLLNDK